MREGHWKLLCDYDGTNPQLYDLERDRGESTNLASKHPEVIARMIESLLEWNQSMPSDNGLALGAEQPKKKSKGKKKAM